MTEPELRKKCNLGPKDLISTNIGMLDILTVEKNTVTFGIIDNGRTFTDSCDSVIKKMEMLNAKN
jgi:hypothetical protein